MYYNYISNNLLNSFNLLIKQWKVIIISKRVGISEAIRLILVSINIKKNFLKLIAKLLLTFIFKYFYNSNKKVNIFVNIMKFSFRHNIFHDNLHSISTTNISPRKTGDSLNKFNEWLAGLIDGDGYFLLTKKGYVSCEITMDIRDKAALFEIKHKYGGSIKPISGANALKYKLRNKKGLIALINGVNGLIRNPTRLLQLNKLCLKYQIDLKLAKPLTYNNGWLSGFIDSDGSVYLNEKSGQLFISIAQKNIFLLEPLIDLYGGKIYPHGSIDAFKYVIYRKDQIFNLIDNYLIKHPLKTAKSFRINLAKDFYLLRDYKTNVDQADKYSRWITFKNKWDKYNN